MILNEAVGDESTPLTVCLLFEGVLEAPDDTLRPISRVDCAGKSSRVAPPIAADPFLAGRLAPVTRLRGPR